MLNGTSRTGAPQHKIQLWLVLLLGFLVTVAWASQRISFVHHSSLYRGRYRLNAFAPCGVRAGETICIGGAIRETRTSIASTASPEDTSKTRKRKKGTGRKKKAESQEPYWKNVSDPVHIDCSDQSSESIVPYRRVRFTVRGNPLPLRRHRTSRGFIYNPSANAQKCFRAVVSELIFGANDTQATESPPFGNSTALAMTIVFRAKRPQSHFVANKRGRPLKTSSPSESKPIRTDVDNLAKFVLDSLNGLLYADDHQISSLCVTKVLDSQDMCFGSTEVAISVMNPNVSELLLNSFQLYDF